MLNAALLAERRFDFDIERAISPTVPHRLMVSGSVRWRDEDIAGFGPGTESHNAIEERSSVARPGLFGEGPWRFPTRANHLKATRPWSAAGLPAARATGASLQPEHFTIDPARVAEDEVCVAHRHKMSALQVAPPSRYSEDQGWG